LRLWRLIICWMIFSSACGRTARLITLVCATAREVDGCVAGRQLTGARQMSPHLQQEELLPDLGVDALQRLLLSLQPAQEVLRRRYGRRGQR
jgi:hypothetical protein